MPTYKTSPGAVTACKKVTATDVFTINDDGAIIEVDQPAGTILTEVIVRFTNTSTHAASSEAGYKLGLTSGASTLGLDVNGFLNSGTTITTDNVYFLRQGPDAVAAGTNIFTSLNSASPALARGYTDLERTLFLTFVHSNHAVNVNSNVEVNFVFTHLN